MLIANKYMYMFKNIYFLIKALSLGKGPINPQKAIAPRAGGESPKLCGKQ